MSVSFANIPAHHSRAAIPTFVPPKMRLPEPLFVTAIRRYPIRECTHRPLPIPKIQMNQATALPTKAPRVSRLFGQNRRVPFRSKSQGAERSEQTAGLHTAGQPQPEEATRPRAEERPVAVYPRSLIQRHRAVIDEGLLPYDVPPITSPNLVGEPYVWPEEFAQQVREAMDELQGTALGAILKKWTDGMIQRQPLLSSDEARKYLRAISSSILLGPEDIAFCASRIAEIFVSHVRWLSNLHKFDGIFEPEVLDYVRSVR
jgi:hypothetical protein